MFKIIEHDNGHTEVIDKHTGNLLCIIYESKVKANETSDLKHSSSSGSAKGVSSPNKTKTPEKLKLYARYCTRYATAKRLSEGTTSSLSPKLTKLRNGYATDDEDEDDEEEDDVEKVTSIQTRIEDDEEEIEPADPEERFFKSLDLVRRTLEQQLPDEGGLGNIFPSKQADQISSLKKKSRAYHPSKTITGVGFSSVMGQWIVGLFPQFAYHRESTTNSKGANNDYEIHCCAPVNDNDAQGPALRSQGVLIKYPLTYRPQRPGKLRHTHVYSFNSWQRQERLTTIVTGLNKKARYLKSQCKTLSVCAKRLLPEEINFWMRQRKKVIALDNGKVPVVSLKNLSPHEINKWIQKDSQVLRNGLPSCSSTLHHNNDATDSESTKSSSNSSSGTDSDSGSVTDFDFASDATSSDTDSSTSSESSMSGSSSGWGDNKTNSSKSSSLCGNRNDGSLRATSDTCSKNYVYRRLRPLRGFIQPRRCICMSCDNSKHNRSRWISEITSRSRRSWTIRSCSVVVHDVTRDFFRMGAHIYVQCPPGPPLRVKCCYLKRDAQNPLLLPTIPITKHDSVHCSGCSSYRRSQGSLTCVSSHTVTSTEGKVSAPATFAPTVGQGHAQFSLSQKSLRPSHRGICSDHWKSLKPMRCLPRTTRSLTTKLLRNRRYTTLHFCPYLEHSYSKCKVRIRSRKAVILASASYSKRRRRHYHQLAKSWKSIRNGALSKRCFNNENVFVDDESLTASLNGRVKSSSRGATAMTGALQSRHNTSSTRKTLKRASTTGSHHDCLPLKMRNLCHDHNGTVTERGQDVGHMFSREHSYALVGDKACNPHQLVDYHQSSTFTCHKCGTSTNFATQEDACKEACHHLFATHGVAEATSENLRTITRFSLNSMEVHLVAFPGE